MDFPMVRTSHQRVLLIGDVHRELTAALARAWPGALVRHASNVFDGIAELMQDRYGAVLAAAEPVGRRPEAAVRTLRELVGDGRIILFGDASLEPLSRRMLQFGCDDYLITPVSAGDVDRVLCANGGKTVGDGGPPLRLHTDGDVAPAPAAPPPRAAPPSPAPPPSQPDRAPGDDAAAAPALPLTQILLEALLEHPGEATAQAIAQLNAHLAALGTMHLSYRQHEPAQPAAETPADGCMELDYPLHDGAGGSLGLLSLRLPAARQAAGRAILAELGPLLAKTVVIQRRQARLQRLAFTDDLTGLFNCRYFKHFLARTLAEARKNRFPVTLFLFDIDNFKTYNDRFGHAVGDDILKQTSALMRRCVRDHDLVARIGGDEFAVVFWEKEGPRTPRGDASDGVPGRPPSEPRQILARFRRLLMTQTYPLLGASGRGTLTISGGLAVYPYDATDSQALIDAADKALMFGAKRGGRNSIHLVGGESSDPPIG
jgi:GGDEF domain-containing protein